MMTPTEAAVLIVDDEAIIRQQLSRALATVGIAADCAANGEEAIEHYARRRHPLVVTDLRMPERHGHSLSNALLRESPPPQIIALTGVHDPRLKADLLNRGVAKVVYKPVDYSWLAHELKRLIDAGKPRAETPTRSASQSATVQSTPAQPAPAQPPRAEPLSPKKRDSSPAGAPSDAEIIRDHLEELPCQLPPGNEWITTALMWMDWQRIANPPDELMKFAWRRAPTLGASSAETQARVGIYEVAIAVPLNTSRQPCGAPVKLVVRDLSSDEVGMVHTTQLECNCLAIVWITRKKTRAIRLLEPVKRQQSGSYFEIESRIIT